MDSTLGAVIITATLGLIGAVLAVRQALATVQATSAVAENTNDIELAKVQIEGWAKFVESYRIENERLTHALAEERAVSQAFAAKAERLAAELEACRQEERREEPDQPVA